MAQSLCRRHASLVTTGILSQRILSFSPRFHPGGLRGVVLRTMVGGSSRAECQGQAAVTDGSGGRRGGACRRGEGGCTEGRGGPPPQWGGFHPPRQRRRQPLSSPPSGSSRRSTRRGAETPSRPCAWPISSP